MILEMILENEKVSQQKIPFALNQGENTNQNSLYRDPRDNISILLGDISIEQAKRETQSKSKTGFNRKIISYKNITI